MKTMICILLLMVFTNMYAQQKAITAAEAKNYMGQTVTVFDRIHEARLKNIAKDELNVLYTGEDYEHRTLALLFPKDVMKRFSYNPNAKMINHTFYATGKIVSYEGKPAMYIKEEDQLNIPESEAATGP